MGTHLEAHRQRYIASGDFAAFWLDYETALYKDALIARGTMFLPTVMAALTEVNEERSERMLAAIEKSLTPEELLAALEPPKPEPSPFPRDPRLRGSLEGTPLSFGTTWHALVNSLGDLWVWSMNHYIFPLMLGMGLMTLLIWGVLR